jgi:hypothetical protein
MRIDPDQEIIAFHVDGAIFRRHLQPDLRIFSANPAASLPIAV